MRKLSYRRNGNNDVPRENEVGEFRKIVSSDEINVRSERTWVERLRSCDDSYIYLARVTIASFDPFGRCRYNLGQKFNEQLYDDLTRKERAGNLFSLSGIC